MIHDAFYRHINYNEKELAGRREAKVRCSSSQWLEHVFIANAVVPQALHQPITGAARRHADALNI